MKKYFSILFLMALALAFWSCGFSDKEKDGEDTGSVSYSQAVDVLNLIWENTSEDDRFPSFGGSQDNPVMDAPGSVDLGDTDMLSYTLLVPEDLQGNVTDAASLVHMMNGNTFTGAALKIEGTDVKKAADAVKDTVAGNQFVCGFPEQLVVVTAGDYVFYAFGATEIVEKFKATAESKVEGAKVVWNQLLE
ncbi:MAG: hypothetical protein NC307_13625 [Roseburia sp.]|nr:hypothetical protein [Roseburia sp.]